MVEKHKLVALDVLRGLACIMVWASHLRVGTGYFSDSKYDFIQSFASWGRESVVIFFMLSGIVINLSSQNIHDRAYYFKKRFLRIYPIYFIVLVMCFLADYVVFHRTVIFQVYIGNFFLLGTIQHYICVTAPLNPAVWSIGCEAFFYTVFGLFYKPGRLASIWIWFIISCIAIAWKIYINNFDEGIQNHLLFLVDNSFLWLLGYFVFEYRNRFRTTLPVALCGLLIIPMITRLQKLSWNYLEFTYFLEGIYLLPLFIYLLKNYRPELDKKKTNIPHSVFILIYIVNFLLLWKYSASLTKNKILYSILPALSFLIYYQPLVRMLRWLYGKISVAFSALAAISYPVYLLHLPVFYVIYKLLPDQKLIGISLAMATTIVFGYLLEYFFYRKLSQQKKKVE